MAQFERPQRHVEVESATPSEQTKLAVHATLEHYRRGADILKLSSPTTTSSPTAFSSPVVNHDAEDDHNHHQKKSVLTKVKEKAKKLKHSLSTRKRHHDIDIDDTEASTPSRSANVHENEVEEEVEEEEEEEDEEDAEYLGAPMYKSETTPEEYKETTKLQSPVLSEKHVLSSGFSENSNTSLSSEQIVAESMITKLPNEIFTGVVLTRTLSSKRAESTKPRNPRKSVSAASSPHKPQSSLRQTVTENEATNTRSPKKPVTETMNEKLGAGYATVSEKLGTGYASVMGTLGTVSHTTSEKLGTGYNAASEKLVRPAYATVSDVTHAIASKIESLTLIPPFTDRESDNASHPDPSKTKGLTVTTPPPSQSFTPHASSKNLSASAAAASEHMYMLHADLEVPQPSSAPAGPAKKADQIWDKGVSVKEYLIHKFEPGEDERALSQVILDVMSPGRGPGEAGVVEKVKGAITSLLRSDESSTSTTVSRSPYLQTQSSASPIIQPALSTSPRILISTNAYEVVEEENQGRRLQTN